MRKYHTSFGSLDSAVIKSDELFDTVKNSFPINDKELKNVDKAENTLRPPSDKFSRTQLLLSGWQMVEENFPLPIKGLMERKYPGYVLTKDEYKHVTPFSPMIAIDCEMCKTTTGDLILYYCVKINLATIKKGFSSRGTIPFFSFFHSVCLRLFWNISCSLCYIMVGLHLSNLSYRLPLIPSFDLLLTTYFYYVSTECS